MKKTLITVIILAIIISLTILVVIGYVVSYKKFYSLDPNVKIITGPDINNYKGVKYNESYHIEPGPVRVDLKEIKNIDPSEIKKLENLKLTAGPKNGVIDAVKFLTPRPIDSAYILYSCTFTDLKFINLKTKELETYSYPVPPAYIVDCAWIGKDLLIHYFSNGTVPGSQIKFTPRTDNYYFFSPETGIFTLLGVDRETSKYTAHTSNSVMFFKKTDAEKFFVVGYCTRSAFEMGCVKHGFSISNGTTIKKIFNNLDFDPGAYSPAYEWGWSGDNFFIKQTGKVYLVDINKLF
ncbi:MAG: hypothetical protein Q7K35_02190 [bacterium]|nr:hypothetical protein [bacterium]